MDTPVEKNPCLQCLKSEVVKGLVTQLKNETDYIRSQGAKPLMKSVEALEAYAKAVKEIE